MDTESAGANKGSRMSSYKRKGKMKAKCEVKVGTKTTCKTATIRDKRASLLGKKNGCGSELHKNEGFSAQQKIQNEKDHTVADATGKDDKKKEAKVKNGELKLKDIPFTKKLHCGVCKTMNQQHGTPEFSEMKDLEIHRQQLHSGFFNPKDMRCVVCSKTFTSLAGLHDHLTKHTGEKSYECPTCKKRFSTKRGVKKHSAKHAELQYNCSECNKSFKARFRLNRHKKVRHSQKEADKFNCPEPNCDVRFPTDSVNVLKTHYKEKHHRMLIETDLYSCAVCSEKWFFKKKLKRHFSIRHKSNKQSNWCSFCKNVFDSEELLRNHIKKCDNGGRKQFHCALCKAQFTHHCNLKRHLKGLWHMNKEMEYKKAQIALSKDKGEGEGDLAKMATLPCSLPRCTSCRSTFLSDHLLAQHVQEMHTRPSDSRVRRFICNKDGCNKPFLKQSHLDTHILGKHGESPAFKCTKCGTAYKYSSNFQKHLCKPPGCLGNVSLMEMET